MPEPSKRSIEQYYAEFAEADRLTSGMGQLEFERTKRISQRFLPRHQPSWLMLAAAPARVLSGWRNSDMRPISPTAQRGWLSFLRVASEQIPKRRVLARLKLETQDRYRFRVSHAMWS